MLGTPHADRVRRGVPGASRAVATDHHHSASRGDLHRSALVVVHVPVVEQERGQRLSGSHEDGASGEVPAEGHQIAAASLKQVRRVGRPRARRLCPILSDRRNGVHHRPDGPRVSEQPRSVGHVGVPHSRVGEDRRCRDVVGGAADVGGRAEQPERPSRSGGQVVRIPEAAPPVPQTAGGGGIHVAVGRGLSAGREIEDGARASRDPKLDGSDRTGLEVAPHRPLLTNRTTVGDPNGGRPVLRVGGRFGGRVRCVPGRSNTDQGDGHVGTDDPGSLTPHDPVGPEVGVCHRVRVVGDQRTLRGVHVPHEVGLRRRAGGGDHGVLARPLAGGEAGGEVERGDLVGVEALRGLRAGVREPLGQEQRGEDLEHVIS